jgi:hypothetical protein
MAQDLGLHQSCEEWTIPEAEKQCRQRIWWSLYIMDRFNSALFGKPLTIVDEVNFLNNLNRTLLASLLNITTCRIVMFPCLMKMRLGER